MNQPSAAKNKWLVAATVMVPTTMEILDTSVANVSLPHIQGSLNAGLEEVTWVLTSYLVANAVVLPMTGWLSVTIGRKRFLMSCVAGFTFFSFMCGSAPTLGFLIMFRLMQGVFGGAMQPMSQAILLESFPKEERGTAMAFYGMGVVTGPIFGPLLGGYITDHLTWRWIFFINVPIGIVSVVAILAVITDPPYLAATRRKLDAIGMGLLVVGIGAFQIVLDKGNQEDWFDSRFILLLSALAVCALLALIWWELFGTGTPIVNLRAYRIRSFAVGSSLLFLTFFAFFSSIVLLPLYLQNLMKYTAFQAGTVLGPGGLATLFMMPVVGALVQRGRARQILAFGMCVAAASLYLMSEFNLDADYRSVILPRIIQGVGMSCFFVPLTTLTMSEIPQEQIGNTTGLYNLLRNLGGSMGVAVATTLLSRRAQFHQYRITEKLDLFDPNIADTISNYTHFLVGRGIPLGSAHQAALSGLYGQIVRQSTMLAFNDCFRFMFWATLSITPLILLFKTLNLKKEDARSNSNTKPSSGTQQK